jgi:peptidoglycan/xylan/chitin deacetylase (PgdA/CDA1 family)
MLESLKVKKGANCRLNLRHAAIIATALVLIAGFAMITPLYLREDKAQPKQEIMLSFSVLESENVVEWCQNLSSILNTHNMGAVVFFVGKVAEQNPQAVTCFGNKIDIGSQTFSYVNLTSIYDYSKKLQEVKLGKAAVDSAGQLNSKVFYAPYGATDPDIYSLLSRSGILVDFSYTNQYDVYKNGQFVRFDAAVFKATDHSPEFYLQKDQITEPEIIEFDNTWATSKINSFLDNLGTGNLDFINASGLTGFDLTSK